MSSTSSMVLNAAVLPAPLPTIPSCQFALSLHRPPLSARSHVPLPIKQAREDLSGGEAAAQHVAGGVRDAGAGGVHVEPHRALTRERTDGDVDGAAAWSAETPEIAPVSPPPSVAVKSDASTPLTGSLNVTRNTMASALPDAAVGFRRLMDTTAGADVSTIDGERRRRRARAAGDVAVARKA